MLKSFGTTIAFLALMAAMVVDKGCDRAVVVVAAPVETAAPVVAPKARKAPPKARKAPVKPLSVRKAERAARCWGQACYHDSGYRGGRADDRIVRE